MSAKTWRGDKYLSSGFVVTPEREGGRTLSTFPLYSFLLLFWEHHHQHQQRTNQPKNRIKSPAADPHGIYDRIHSTLLGYLKKNWVDEITMLEKET